MKKTAVLGLFVMALVVMGSGVWAKSAPKPCKDGSCKTMTAACKTGCTSTAKVNCATTSNCTKSK